MTTIVTYPGEINEVKYNSYLRLFVIFRISISFVLLIFLLYWTYASFEIYSHIVPSHLAYSQPQAKMNSTTNNTGIINISNTPGNEIIQQISTNPKIVATGNDVFIIWQDNYLGNNDIFFKRSTDGGASFKDAINLSNTTGDSLEPQIVIGSGIIFVIWKDFTSSKDCSSYACGQILFKRSTDGGASFESTKNITGAQHGNPDFIRVASSNNNVYLLWEDGTYKGSIFLAKSTDGGASFESTIKVDNFEGYLKDLGIAASNNKVFIIWADEPFDQNASVFFKRSTDGGASFESKSILTNQSLPKTTIAMQNFGEELFIASNYPLFTNGTQQHTIFLAKSTDGGASFESKLNITGNEFEYPELNVYPDFIKLSSSNNNLYVLWNSGFYKDLVLAKSTNGGVNFEIDELEDIEGYLEDLDLASSNNTVYLTWIYDNEVHFGKYPLPNTTSINLIEDSSGAVYSNTDKNCPVTIDGKIGTCEWMDAIKNVQSNVILLSKLDNKNLNILTIVQGQHYNTHRGNAVIAHLFDDEGNGLLDHSDDILIMNKEFANQSNDNGPFIDGYWDSNYPYTYQDDTKNGGSMDGTAAISFANGTEVFEMSRPLCSKDLTHDLCINPSNLTLNYELILGINNDFQDLFYEPYFDGMQDFNVFLGLNDPICCFMLDEIIPPGSFVLAPLGRFSTVDRDALLDNLTSFEKERLSTSPEAKDVVTFINSLNQNDIVRFLSILSNEELTKTMGVLDPPDRTKLLQKISLDDRTKLLQKISLDDRTKLFGNPNENQIINFLNNLN